MAQYRTIFNTHQEYYFVKGARGHITRWQRVKIIDKERAEYKQMGR